MYSGMMMMSDNSLSLPLSLSLKTWNSFLSFNASRAQKQSSCRPSLTTLPSQSPSLLPRRYHLLHHHRHHHRPPIIIICDNRGERTKRKRKKDGHVLGEEAEDEVEVGEGKGNPPTPFTSVASLLGFEWRVFLLFNASKITSFGESSILVRSFVTSQPFAYMGFSFYRFLFT